MQLNRGIGSDGGVDGNRKRGDTAIEEEFFALRAGRSFDGDRGGRRVTRREVMIFGIVHREISGALGIDMDGVPSDGAGRFFAEERIITGGESGIGGVGMRIPLGDEALAKETLTETVVSRGE